MSGHSIISPSTAHIWGPPNGCRAHPFIALQFLESETDDDRAGTAAHALAREMIEAHVGGGKFPLPVEMIGEMSVNGVIIDRDIYDSAQIYATDVVETWRKENTTSPVLEKSIVCPLIHSESFGTPDCYSRGSSNNTIYIWDFKNGHVSVDPFENWQCINYLSGILDLYGINGKTDQTTRIVITIVQPNAYDGKGPVKRWECKASDLRNYFNILHASAEEVFEQAGTTTRSGAHCRFCPARFGCVSAIRAGLALYESRDASGIAASPEAIGTHYAIVSEAYDRLTAVKKGLETQIESMLRSGQQVPGVRLDKTLSRSREWIIPEADLLITAQQAGINLCKETVMSPIEAERAGLGKDIVNSLSTRRETGFSVKRDDLNNVRRIFYGSN